MGTGAETDADADADTGMGAGAVQGGSGSVAAASGVLQSGSGRPIAVPTKVRMKKLPDVPTFFEQGVTDKAFQVQGWIGLVDGNAAKFILRRDEFRVEFADKR